MFVSYNPNPMARRIGDCAVRAVSIAIGEDWDLTYLLIALAGMRMGTMMEDNDAWGSVLRQHGFVRAVIPNTCPDCYTVADFCRDHPKGTFVLGAEKHAVCAVDGDWIDIWNSADETVLFYWYRKEE